MRRIKTREGREYRGNSSQFTDKGDHIEFRDRGTTHRIYKVNIVEDEEDCFIAAYIYGSSQAREVVILRRFRDEYLVHGRVGAALVGLYYSWLSGAALFTAKVLGAPARAMMRVFLNQLVTFAGSRLQDSATGQGRERPPRSE